MSKLEFVWTFLMSFVLGLVILKAGSMYMDWYNEYHGNIEAVIDCELKLIEEYREVGLDVPMNSREMYDHCAAEILASKGGR